MKKTLAGTIIAVALAFPCSAADIGVGVSMKQGENTLFLPIRYNNQLIFEGFFAHDHSISNSTSTDFQTYDMSYTSSTIGVGVFWVKPITDNSHIYLGPRLAYISSTNTSTTHAFNNYPGFTSEFKTHGYSITPTFGFEYFPIKYLSVGGEVGYRYTKSDGTNSQSGAGSASFNATNTGTVTSLILRLYF